MAFDVVRVLIRNTVGTQDITIAGFGTPKGAIFDYSYDTTDDFLRTNYRKSVGFTDGITSVAHAASSVDNVSISDAYRSLKNNAVIQEINNGSEVAVAEFDSWITDGVRINVTTASGTQRFCVVTLIGGVNVDNVYVNIEAHSGSSTTTTISGLGFSPDLVLFSSIGTGITDNISVSDLLANGFALKSGGNYCIMESDRRDISPTVTEIYTSDQYCIGRHFNGSLSWGSYATNFGADGFDLVRTSIGTSGIGILAVKFSTNVTVEAEMLNSPTVTGVQSLGSATVQPTYAHILTGMSTALNTQRQGLSAGKFIAGANGAFGVSTSSTDAVSTTEVNSISAQDKIIVLDSGSRAIEAGFLGFNSSGLSVDVTQSNGTARKWPALWIAEADGGVILSPTGIPTAEAFGTAEVNRLLQFVSPTSILSQEMFGTPDVQVLGVTVSPSGIMSEEDFGNAAVRLLLQVVTPNGIMTSEVFGVPVIVGGEPVAFYLTNQGVKYTVNGSILITIVNE